MGFEGSHFPFRYSSEVVSFVQKHFAGQSMRVPNEQVAAHDRDPTESETIDASHQRNTMQGSRRRRARDVTDETNSLPPTVSIEDVSDDIASPCDENQDSLGEQFANLEISSPVLPRSPSPLLSPDYPLQSVEAAERTTIRGPISVRDLINATPRPSSSPEPHTQPALRAYGDLVRAQSETVDEPNSPAAGEEPDTENEPILYEVLDEPLPPGPFSDRDYQNALKSAKALTGEIFMNLCHCEGSARPGTQLHKIKQRAEALNKLDNPASRTIGIVGDSAAGKDEHISVLTTVSLLTLLRKKQPYQLIAPSAQSSAQGQISAYQSTTVADTDTIGRPRLCCDLLCHRVQKAHAKSNG